MDTNTDHFTHARAGIIMYHKFVIALLFPIQEHINLNSPVP